MNVTKKMPWASFVLAMALVAIYSAYKLSAFDNHTQFVLLFCAGAFYGAMSGAVIFMPFWETKSGIKFFSEYIGIKKHLILIALWPGIFYRPLREWIFKDTIMEKFTFFWGERPFSQWSPSEFTVDGRKYNTAEQYMMDQKAAFFGDEEIRKDIMEAIHPADQKRLGRQVKGFDTERWQLVCKDFVYKGNYEKFKQNADMKEALFATAGTILVEASPKDKIWGIGLKKEDPRCQDRSTWQGTNWLGEVLTKVRDDLMAEEANALRSNQTV
jgi:ribA/ribD-fused uncharacterized protein